MYFGDFTKRDDVLQNFAIDRFDGQIVFAAYEYKDYSGEAVVIYVHGGKFFHVSGSHCSCFGLEGQWSPEEMPIEAILHMSGKGYGILNEYHDIFNNIFTQIRGMNLETLPPEAAETWLKLMYA